MRTPDITREHDPTPPPALSWSPSLADHLDTTHGEHGLHGLVVASAAWVHGPVCSGWEALPQVPHDAVLLIPDRRVSGPLRSYGLEQWRALALAQGETLTRRNTRIRTLIRERKEAGAAREAAVDLAEQYARDAGVDVARDDVLRHVGQYWDVRARHDESWTRLEEQRIEVLRIADDLMDLAGGKWATDIDVPDLARRVAKTLRAVATAQQPRRAVTMFARPASPR